MSLDARRIPARPDLAAAHLKGKVQAAQYADATPLVVSVPLAPMTACPDGNAPMENQLLYGETLAAYERDGEWAWGQTVDALGGEGYVGYVPRACLAPAGPQATHRVARPITHVYPAPELKSRPIGWLSYGALLQIESVAAGYAVLSAGGFVPAQHLAGLDAPAADWVAEAEQLLGAPYLWGGRAPTGLDCSALVQLAMHAAGRACPRDADMQEAELGRTLDADTAPKRGDLVFWEGHVGIMLDAERLLHCNAHHMATAIEPVETARARILAAAGSPVTRHARLDAAKRGG